MNSIADEEDFDGTTQVITFQPGESSKTVSIPIVNDVIAECDEEFGGQLALPERSQNLKVSIRRYSAQCCISKRILGWSVECMYSFLPDCFRQ